MTWLSFCARRPGPDWKQGYGMGDRTLGQIEGVVDHSMEGSMAAAMGVLDGPRSASWTFSIPKVGEPVQHYALQKITWHAGLPGGLPGDRRHDTSLIGNLTLIGKEHEGVAGEPWTENQLFWSAKIDVALRALCPRFGANPPTLKLNMWEHTWLSATSCPSGRNPWQEKFKLINEWEDEMDGAEVRRIAKEEADYAVKTNRDGQVGFNQAQMDLIEQVARAVAGGGGGGLTIEEIVDALVVELKLR